jgi:hypothetical protein
VHFLLYWLCTIRFILRLQSIKFQTRFEFKTSLENRILVWKLERLFSKLCRLGQFSCSRPTFFPFSIFPTQPTRPSSHLYQRCQPDSIPSAPNSLCLTPSSCHAQETAPTPWPKSESLSSWSEPNQREGDFPQQEPKLIPNPLWESVQMRPYLNPAVLRDKLLVVHVWDPKNL